MTLLYVIINATNAIYFDSELKYNCTKTVLEKQRPAPFQDFELGL